MGCGQACCQWSVTGSAWICAHARCWQPLSSAPDDLLGSEKLGLGPTAVALTRRGPWTVGAPANHIWSVAGDDSRADVNRTSLQPFVAYTTPDAWTFTVDTESSCDWEAEPCSVPLNAQVSKVVKLGPLPVSLEAGVRYWADSPSPGRGSAAACS